MLKKYLLLFLITASAAGIAAIEFFMLAILPNWLASTIHNILAFLIGLGFVVTAHRVHKKTSQQDTYVLALLCVGVSMMSLHFVKLFFPQCS